MTIGIICAMNEEINLLQQDITAHHVTTIAGRDFHVGTLYGMSVVLVTGRIGKVAAGVTAALLIHHFQVDKIIFSGTAGGVNPDLNVGDAVVADKSVQHDFKLPWGDAFRIPLLEVSYMESDHELTALAKQAVQDYIDTRMMQDIPQTYLDAFHIRNPKVVTGTIASGDEFVAPRRKISGCTSMWTTSNAWRWRVRLWRRSVWNSACRSPSSALFPTAPTTMPAWTLTCSSKKPPVILPKA